MNMPTNAGAQPPRHHRPGTGGWRPGGWDGGDDLVDLRRLLLTLWRGKWIVAVCALIAAGLAFVAVRQLEPTYTASAKVMFNPPQFGVAALQETATSAPATAETLATEMEVLRSTALLSRVVDELKLVEEPAFNPRLRDGPPALTARLRAAADPRTWIPRDLLAGLGVIEPPPPAPSATPETPSDAERERRAIVDALAGRLRFDPIEGSRVVVIRLTTTDPHLSARVVNSVADQYIVDRLEAKLAATRQATGWLQDRVGELREQVRRDEAAVEAKRAELNAATGASSDVMRQQLADLNRQLAEVRGRTLETAARVERVEQELAGTGDLASVPAFRRAEEMQVLWEREDELGQREAALLDSVEAGHPAVVRVRGQLENVRAELRAEAERIAAALANELDVLRGREARLERRVAELEAGTIDQRRLELQLRELERAAESSRAVYENFLERFTEMAQQEEIQQADARVLTPADVPGAPDATRRNSTVMAGGIGGMLLGVGLVFLLDRLNNTFRGVGQLEQATTLPVTASLPLIRPGAKRSVVAEVSDRPASPLAEAMRHLRTSILLSDLDHPPKVVMITSAVPGEGKSTTSALLALTGTTAGQSAVVVDADLRHSALSAMLGDDAAARGPGLVGVLEGSAGLADAVVTDATTGLQVLPAGARLTGVNAADVLASQRFHRLVDELRARYDLVVVDTPPTLAVTDARIVATLVDAVVFAVHWDRTPRAAALDGLRELYSVDAPVIGTALTLVNEAKAARYADGGYGSYYGKYRGAYAEA